MNHNNEYTAVEMMIIATAREIQDGDIVFVGTYWPILAGLLAKRTHAPTSLIVLEGGVIRDSNPERIPLVVSDPCMISGSLLCGDCFDTLGMILHAGQADAALLSATTVDKYGNINTTCVGDYSKPKTRLSGSGGACDFGCLANKVLIMLEHHKRRFPERVDYVTTPGYLEGFDSREKAGLKPNTGPSAVITTLGLFRFESDSKEMYLDAHYPGIDVQKVKESMGWELKVSPEVKIITPPTEKELRTLREDVDPDGMFLRDARTVS
ncbi:MAG: CoA-transferase [Chloroflexota bacterium]|nr:CoA-transferase [Chloroflexota bacterium]